MQALGILFIFLLLLVILPASQGNPDAFAIWRGIGTTIQVFFSVLFWGGIALVLFLMRNVLRDASHACIRWYFFTFHPHPAAPMVQTALRTGDVLNGKAIAAALGEMPDNRILREVRIAQGEELVRQMQEMSRWHLQKLQTQAHEEYERAAVQSIQEAIALAAAALERAKAYYRASQTAGARY